MKAAVFQTVLCVCVCLSVCLSVFIHCDDGKSCLRISEVSNKYFRSANCFDLYKSASDYCEI